MKLNKHPSKKTLTQKNTHAHAKIDSLVLAITSIYFCIIANILSVHSHLYRGWYRRFIQVSCVVPFCVHIGHNDVVSHGWRHGTFPGCVRFLYAVLDSIFRYSGYAVHLRRYLAFPTHKSQHSSIYTYFKKSIQIKTGSSKNSVSSSSLELYKLKHTYRSLHSRR